MGTPHGASVIVAALSVAVAAAAALWMLPGTAATFGNLYTVTVTPDAAAARSTRGYRASRDGAAVDSHLGGEMRHSGRLYPLIAAPRPFMVLYGATAGSGPRRFSRGQVQRAPDGASPARWGRAAADVAVDRRHDGWVARVARSQGGSRVRHAGDAGGGALRRGARGDHRTADGRGRPSRGRCSAVTPDRDAVTSSTLADSGPHRRGLGALSRRRRVDR